MLAARLRGWSKRGVLRAGYGAVIAVLVLSAAEAYRIQSSVSQQHLVIYRNYVDLEDTLATLRRSLWLAGNYVRDYFLHTKPDQAEMLRSQIEELKAEDEKALAHLEGIPGAGGVAPKLRQSLREFWTVLAPVPETMRGASDAEKFDFVQRVVVPRRGELYTALLALTSASQQQLQQSESEFSGARRRAAERLVLMLAFSVLLCYAVARLSVRHAEFLERRAERQYAEAEQARRELQQLSARLLELEEEGRRRLSRELHDEIGQALALMQIEVSHALAVAPGQPAALRERLTRARELAERTVQTIRHISLLLRPALLDDLGLTPALQFQLEDFLRRSGIACEFVDEGVADQLPDSVKTCVYRVVQEALHNCEKHSGASKVRVVVRQLADCLLVEIEDDGKGFDSHAPRAGLGLLGMRERVSITGGTLLIDSSPGHGTRIALRLPLAPATVEATA
jgi:signal transduction histidine kinase